MSVWSLALGGSESRVDQNQIDIWIRPSHAIRVEWSSRNHLLTPPARSMMSSASPSVLLEVHLLKTRPVVGVVKLIALS